MRKSFKKLFIALPLATLFISSCGNDNNSSHNNTDTNTKEVIHVKSVGLNKTSLEMRIGQTEDLVASVLPENAENKNLTWSSSQADVASVNNGHIIALKAGETTITVKTVDGEKTATCAVKVVADAYSFNIRTGAGNVKTLTKDVNFDLKQSDRVQLDITKNGGEWFDAKINTTIEGTADVIQAVNAKDDVDNCYDVVFSGKNGTATVKFALEGLEEAGTLSITYNVTEYFLHQTIRRANVTEADNKITFDGTGQHTAVVKKSDTNWVLKATLDITKYEGDNSVGLGGFTDQGDHALWFALKNKDRVADQYAGIYMLDFYNGWDARKEVDVPKPYNHLVFNETENKSAITADFELIRNGLEYYYNIGGYHGKYTSAFAGASYAGFFSQEKEVVITNYSIAYGEEAALAAIGDNYSENAKIDAGCFIDPNINEIVRDESRTFTVKMAPTYSNEAYVMEADEAYAEHVEIDGLKVSIKNTAPKGNMTLTLKSASGKVLDSIVLAVEEETSEKSNEQLTVKGGVILNDDGSIVFPESKMNINGVGNENAYDGNNGYGAILKQKVLGGDFTIEFDVSDYKTTAQYPKLMVSLGGVESQFYLAYGYGGGENSRFETHTCSSQYYGGQWNNTEDFPSFDKNASHHYKIESKNGYYNFYIDGSTTPLTQKCGNDDRNIVVPMGSYYSMLPVRFSTNGVSAKISNIQVTSGEATTLNDLYTYGTRATKVDEGIQTTFPTIAGDAWEVRSRVANGMFASKLFAEATGAYTLKFDVTFSKAMSDGKLGIAFGDHEFHICNAGEGSKVENYPGHWGGPSVGGIALSATTAMQVTITNDGNGKVTVSVPLADGQVGNVVDSGVSATSGLHFWTFNANEADADATVLISNVVIEK